jgi:hypothetical protein
VLAVFSFLILKRLQHKWNLLYFYIPGNNGEVSFIIVAAFQSQPI